MNFLALRKLVEYIYRALSAKQHIVAAALREELAEAKFEAEHISPNTLLWQMAYGVALKLILYGLVERRFNLPSLSELGVGELADAFREAYKVSGFAGFKPSWIDRGLLLIEASSLRGPLRDAIATIKAHAVSDKLGQLYEELMPQEERRRLGEFYTPKPIAEFMVKWALKRRDDHVLDPCVGSGTFLIEALHYMEALGSNAEEAASRLYGVDVNPLAVLMTTINILSRAPNAKPLVFLADFLDLNRLNALVLGFDRAEFDVVVCNPPYTRHHELPPSYKERIARMIEAEAGEPVSRLSSIYLHFFIHSYQFLRDGGRLAFITPSEWMEADYGVALKRFLARKMQVESIVLFGEKVLAFPDALTRACITLASKEAPRKYTPLIELHSWPSISELIEAVEEGVEKDYEWGRVRLCNLASIDPSTKWTPLFEVVTARAMPHFMTKLGSLAKISRGIATGANEFFTLTEHEVRIYGIEREYLKPVIPSARYLKGYDFTESDWELLKREGRKVYLLWCFRRKEELRGTSVLNYIERGEERGFNRRYLTRHRPVWYWVERRGVPDALLIYMFRGGLRFVYNRANAYALNTLHCVYFDEKVKEETSNLKAVLAYLNSSPAFKLARNTVRVYGGGMYKLEPREAMEIPCIDPCKLSTDWREGLATLFDELCVAAKKDRVRENEIRREIDNEVKRLLSSA